MQRIGSSATKEYKIRRTPYTTLIALTEEFTVPMFVEWVKTNIITK
ncbi:hypothetical protein U27_06526 [Candidatus Vecturithrix granuli]|uniref:Uncharacterized protein n=1 Tax=Vecturithrix granuli TaxID=1499967 RepID=A0A081C4N6_VECG1|nr:hypothetical protein U27_06526 [Candidatus Vecturithrix granuli]